MVAVPSKSKYPQLANEENPIEFCLFRASDFSSYAYSLVPHPKFGLNSGVMLMDLDKMRNSGWTRKILRTYELMQDYLVKREKPRRYKHLRF